MVAGVRLELTSSAYEAELGATSSLSRDRSWQVELNHRETLMRRLGYRYIMPRM